MSREIKCKGCGMEATVDRWDYAMVFPAARAPGDSRPKRQKVLVCPVCGQTRIDPSERELSKSRHPSVTPPPPKTGGDGLLPNNVIQFPMERRYLEDRQGDDR